MNLRGITRLAELYIGIVFEYSSEKNSKAAQDAAHKYFDEYLRTKKWFNIHWKLAEKWFLDNGANIRISPPVPNELIKSK